jgi:SPP1 gp7 family putative phage head morphogenesis protein
MMVNVQFCAGHLWPGALFASSGRSHARRLGRLRVKRPDIVVSNRASREAVNAQLDLEVMLAAAVVEQARFFREVGGAFLEEARHAFARRSTHLFAPPAAHHFIYGHVARIAAIFAAVRILGRVQIMKDVGLPLKQARGEFAEVLSGVGVDQAVQYLRSLPVATRRDWEKVIAESQKGAFTAAGVESKVALEELRNLVAKALAEDWSPSEFEKAATELLLKFKTEAGALRTLWNTTTANAMAKGREEMLNDPDVVKIVSFRMYDAIIDNRTRWNHALLDGGIAPWDWPGWERYAPPNGFNCRCTLVGITGSRADSLLGAGFYKDLTEGVPFGAGPDYGFK